MSHMSRIVEWVGMIHHHLTRFRVSERRIDQVASHKMTRTILEELASPFRIR